MTAPSPVAEPTVDKIAHVPLTLQDRCDACGAQAFVRAAILVQESGKMVDLLFCGHHYAKNQVKLTAIAMSIQDETDRINKKASASSA